MRIRLIRSLLLLFILSIRLGVDVHGAYAAVTLDAAELVHGFFDRFDGDVSFFTSGEDGERDAKAAFCLLGGDAHGCLHMRWLLLSCHAGATC